ncbi:MAG: TetR family transcriptional regulator [Subtercola sp.]|nr:TetR family transcriptional regulator [Subtercola sp.]
MKQAASADVAGARGGNGRNGRAAYDLSAVLDIAVGAFNDYGYDATSMGLLAERLGTSKSAVYYHVSGKEDLLRLALERALGGLEGILTLPGAIEGAAEDRLRFVLRGAVAVLVDDLPYVTLLLRLRGNTEIERSALARRRAFDHEVSQLVDRARADGSLRTDVDSGTITRLLFGMINSIVEWYKPGGTLTPAQLADHVISVAFDGLHRPTA